MACSPMVGGGGFGWERRRVEPVLLGQGVAAVARFRSAHALVMKCLRRVGEGSAERVPQCARSHIEQVDSIPAQAVKAFLDSEASAACRANGVQEYRIELRGGSIDGMATAA